MERTGASKSSWGDMVADIPQLSRLMRKADSVAESASVLVKRTMREIRGELANLSTELNLAGSASDREKVYDEIRRRMALLSRRMNKLMEAQNELAARSAAASASKMTGLEVKYSPKRAEAITELVTPAQGENLAAVFTDRMGRNLINSLREATVGMLREQAVAGGSMKDMARDLAARWSQAAKVDDPRFTDASGRTWDTRTYIQMNVRTNTMRVYNDCLLDDVAREVGTDLMRISSGGDPDCDCAAWEGVIISVSGQTKGLPTYEDARNAGCFHPNCTHTLEYVDEVADKKEIELQKAHPVQEGLADDPDAQDERKYEIDQARYMRDNPGMTQDEARIAVDRDNLTASIQSGLVRDDAREIVAKMTDAQVTALCPDGNPPAFEPTKRATRADPHAADEKWNHGSRGGTVHVSRDATVEKILEVCKVKAAKEEKKPEAKNPFAHDPVPEFKTASEGMEYISSTLGVHCAGFEKFDAKFVRGIAEVVADAKAHIGESDKLKGVWTYAEYYKEVLAVQTQERLMYWDLSNVDATRRKQIEKMCTDDAKRDLRRWGITKTKSREYGCARYGFSGTLAKFNGIILNNNLHKMDRTSEVQSGFKAKGCEKPISTVYHEMGHIIDYHLCLNSFGGHGTPQNETLKRIYDDREAVKTGLSQYGAKNSRETVAEAWAEYKMNPNPREIALAIGREIDTISLSRRKKES